MLTFTKKAALVGLGLSGRICEVVSELEKKGEENQSKEALRLKRVFEFLEKEEQILRQKKENLCTRLSNKIRFPNREDINRLEREVSDLAEKFRRWEATGKGETST